MQELLEVVSSIETSHFNAALGNVTKAKKDILLAVKQLNALSKLPQAPQAEIVATLSRFALEYYDKLNKKGMDVSERILWISSKINDSHFPVIQFSPTLTSLDFVSSAAYEDSDATIQLIPESVNGEFRRVQFDNWRENCTDLANLYQDVLTNCSFVSSLLSMTEQKQRLLPSISPQRPNQQYKIRLHFNGAPRTITLDNKLPYFADNRPRNLTLRSSSDDTLMWPALLEKAHMKIMGNGYRFVGSNMSTDTYMLSGWIPEIVTLNGVLPANFPDLWQRYARGEIVLGIGTGKLSAQLASKLDLISDHDYAVIDYKTSSGSLVLKNSWIQINLEAHRYLDISDFNLVRFLYINWNVASLFQHSAMVNIVYEVSSPKHFFEMPQFSISNCTDAAHEVWFLLEKHLPSKHADQLIYLEIYDTGTGERVLKPQHFRCVNANSMSTNNRLKLDKITVAAHSAVTAVVHSTHTATFSLTCYSNTGLKPHKAKYRYPELSRHEGSWSANTSGGNWGLSSYVDNPQYYVEAHTELSLQVGLFTRDPHALVNFHMFHCDSGDKHSPIRDFEKTKLLFNEHYTEGSQMHKVTLKPGAYKLVLSSYERSFVMPYTLLLNHDAKPDELTATKIPSSLGLFIYNVTEAWQNTSRFKINFATKEYNTKVTLRISHRDSRDADHAQSSSYRPEIRGSIFSAATSQPVQINEQWSTSLYGVYVDCVFDEPANYILLVERFEKGSGFCTVEIGASKQLFVAS